MSAFDLAWFVLKKDEGLGEQPRASQRGQIFYDRRRGAIRGHHRGSSVPVEERRRMAREGQIDTSKGVFAPSPNNPVRASHLPEKKPRAPMGTDPETNLMESPTMLTTEQIAERERGFEKSSPFDAAWSMLKEDEKNKQSWGHELSEDYADYHDLPREGYLDNLQYPMPRA